MKNDERASGTVFGRLAVAPAVLLLVVALSGCEGLLDVTLPGDVTEEEAFEPDKAEQLVIGVIANFESSFSTFVAEMSAMESAYWRTSSLYGNQGEYNDPRPNGDNWYGDWQSARALGEQVYEQLSEWSDEEVPDRREMMAAAATYTGLTYQYLGEVYCELAVNGGPAMTQAETLREAEAWFDRAIEEIQTTGDFAYAGTSSMEQLAHLGRARVRFALGTHYADASEQQEYLTGAAADASMVEPDFVAHVTRESTEEYRWNAVYEDHNFQNYGTVAGRVPDPDGIWVEPGGTIPFTGYRYLIVDDEGRAVVDGHPVMEERPLGEAPTSGVADPRVPVEIDPGNMGLEGNVQVYLQQKYTSRSDDMVLAKWAEAQLILAEIEGGQSAVDRINALRDRHGLPHFSSDDPDEIRDAIIEERRREFFFEGRFWADKLRYDLWFPRGQGEAIPRGRGAYGIAVCVLMPITEYQTNPNLTGDGTQHLPGG